MNLERKSGVLAHVTSLPGEWGMGEAGPQARAFGKFLAASGQKLWQILPLNPVGYGWSPYSSNSAFAGNPLLISFNELIENGLLTKQNLADFPKFGPGSIDFPAVIEARMKILNGVCDRFEDTPEFEAFCAKESDWLDDYALFETIRAEQGGAAWTDWPDALRDRDVQTLETFSAKHAAAIRKHKILQYLFSKHWKKTHEFFQGLDVEIAGDVPIFVSGNSVDVWANRELFLLNEEGLPTVVAGVPPDYFSETGQRWGNPLYDWEAHAETNYEWWTARMRRTFELVDIVRIDHFRAFEDYWEIPSEEPTAMNGRWVKGPNLEFFQALEKNLRKLPKFGNEFQLADHVIAEDLGEITDEVTELRKACGFPGMTLLHFRFGEKEMAKKNYRPEGDEENSVVYTGTHDNDTTQSWFEHLDEGERHRVRCYLNVSGETIHRDLIELAMRSPARLAIHPLQDLLGLDGTARMNKPSTTEGNWSWRVQADMLSDEVINWTKQITIDSGR
jgi:4-alpha-glucanotransferase